MNQIYFVSSSGSNSNSGSNEAPWASVQYAIDTITSQAVIQNIDLLIKEGSYPELVLLKPFVGSGVITLKAQTNSPVIQGLIQNGSAYSLENISLKNTVGSAIVIEAGTLQIKDVILSTSDLCIAVKGQGVVSTLGTLQINDNPRSVINCSETGLVLYNSTLTGSSTFSSAFCQISGGKVTIFNSLSSNSFGGDRVNISGGSLTVKTLSTSPVDTLPGSSYGFATGGEIYNENQLIFPADSTLNSAAASVINGSLITEGTISNARLSPTVTTQGNIFNGLSQLVKTDNEGKLPAIDGSLLTGIVIPIPSASSIVNGTLNNARLSEDVTLAGNGFNTANSLLKLTSLGKLPPLDGSDLTNLPQYTTTDASLLTLGTLANGRLSSSVTLAGNSFNAANNLVRLDVLGRLPAVDGSQITNLPTSSVNASSITSGTLDNARLTTSVTLEGNTFNAASKLVKLDSLLRLPAVDGSQLTGLASTTDASLLTSGTLPDARLSTTVTIQGNTFNSPNSLVKLDNSSRLPAVDGSLLTNLPANNNASNLTIGTIADGRLTANVTLAGNTFNTANNLVKLDGTGKLPAIDGSNLTGIVSGSTDAGSLTTGTLADGRLSANVTLLGNIFNTASKLVQLDGTGKLPAIDGSQLTNLPAGSNASNLTTGTLPDARLTANVTLAGNTFNTANNLVKLDGTNRLPAVDGSLLINLPGGAGASTTNLSLDNRTSSTLDILSSTGSDVTLPTATTTEAGLMSAAHVVALGAAIGGGGASFPPTVQLIGNGTLQTFTITHNQGTRNVGVLIYETGSPYESVFAVVKHTTLNAVTIETDVIPTTDQYTAVVYSLSGGASGGEATDLSLGTRTSTTLDILSSTGADVTIPPASTTEAGLMSSADKTALLTIQPPAVRSSNTIVTSSLANNATFTGTIELAKAFIINSISLSAESRIRIYQTAAQLTADEPRSSTTPPTGQHGLIAEFIGTGTLQAQSGITGVNQEAIPSNLIPISITNLSSVAAEITLTINYLPLEN